MATVPRQLIWEIVKKNNSFLVKQFGRSHASVRFSKEPNNLCNLHSYKHSGLANKKTVSIQAGGKDQSVELSTTKTRKQNKPAALVHKSVMRKEDDRRKKAIDLFMVEIMHMRHKLMHEDTHMCNYYYIPKKLDHDGRKIGFRFSISPSSI